MSFKATFPEFLITSLTSAFPPGEEFPDTGYLLYELSFVPFTN